VEQTEIIFHRKYSYPYVESHLHLCQIQKWHVSVSSQLLLLIHTCHSFMVFLFFFWAWQITFPYIHIEYKIKIKSITLWPFRRSENMSRQDLLLDCLTVGSCDFPSFPWLLSLGPPAQDDEMGPFGSWWVT